VGLQKCPDCGADVSTAAAACPKCGRPSGKAKKAMKRVGRGLLIACIPLGLLGLAAIGVALEMRHAKRVFHLQIAAVNAGIVIVELTSCSTTSPGPGALMDALTAKSEEFHLTEAEKKELSRTLAKSMADEIAGEAQHPVTKDFCASISDYEGWLEHIKGLE
jgi:hypothetical protein